MRSPKNQLCAAEPPPSCRTNNIPKRLLSRKQLIAMPPIVARGRSRMVNADIIHCPTNTVDKRTDNRFYGTNSCSVSSGNGSLPPTTVPIKFLERQFIVFASPRHSLYIFLRSRFLTLTLYRCFSRPKRRIQRRKSKDFSQLQKWLRRISRINARSYRKYRESRERGWIRFTLAHFRDAVPRRQRLRPGVANGGVNGIRLVLWNVNATETNTVPFASTLLPFAKPANPLWHKICILLMFDSMPSYASSRSINRHRIRASIDCSLVWYFRTYVEFVE